MTHVLQPDPPPDETPWLEADTLYDEQAYGALVRLSMRHLRRWPRYGVLLAGTLSLVLAGYALVRSGRITLPLLLLLFAGNLLMLLGALAPRLVTRMMVASNRKGEVPRVSFSFHLGHMEVTTGVANRRYYYGDIQRIFDTGTFFVFFFDDKQVFLLRHGNLPGEQAAGLRSFLNLHATKGGQYATRSGDRP